MAFERLLQRTWRENILFSVLVELTYRCNLDCSFCYNDVGLRGVPLSTEQYVQLFEDLREMQVLNLILSGGEPLAHPDFFALGAKARELGFVVRVKSNGHGLRGRVARRLREEVDPFVVEISLHGARAETHDRQTRVPGSFDRLMANIPELRDLGIRLKLNSTLTRWNEGEIEEIFALADALGVPIAVNPIVSPRDDGDRNPLELTASREGRLGLFRIMNRRAAELSERGEAPRVELAGPDEGLAPDAVEKNCGAGSNGLTIDPYGNVLPCVAFRRPVGNLHEATLREIWEHAEGLVEVRELAVAAGRMVDAEGPTGRMMAFCPGHAHSESGDPLLVYPQAAERRELIEQVLREDEAGLRRELLPVVY